MMLYRSTRDAAARVSFREAVMGGLHQSGGLYLPLELPRLATGELSRLRYADYPALALRVISPFVGDEIPGDTLEALARDAFDFPVPLVPVDDETSILELFHGPSCAFKDFGARFMARAMDHFAAKEGKRLHVLVATSGDTGGAVGAAFEGLEHFCVTILFPKGRISPLQEKQLSTFSGNVQPLAVDGSFDDCQALVKRAFTDASLKLKTPLTSANSINIARLVPQAAYYAWASLRVADGADPQGRAGEDRPLCVTVVPSGNFGNLSAGLFAREMGFPLDAFIAATNANRTVPDYLASGEYRPRESLSTISNAMDVGAPSNFERMKDLYDLDAMRSIIEGLSVTDAETRTALRDCHRRTGYQLEPHGAVGWKAWKDLADRYRPKAGGAGMRGVILETAHPAKFAEVVKEELGKDPEMPERLAAVLSKPDNARPMSSRYEDFAAYLASHRG